MAGRQAPPRVEPTGVRLRSPALLYLCAGAVLTGVYFVLPHGAAQSSVYDGFGVATAVAIGVGVWRYRPDARLPWVLFALGNLCLAIGDIIGSLQSEPPVPSAADWVYLSAYPLLAAGLVLLLVRAGAHYRLAALGEALIFSCAFALVQWVYIVDLIVDGSGSLTERAVSAAYPTMDVLLLAALAGFFVTAAWRTPAFLLLVAGVVPLLVADEIYYGFTANTYQAGNYLDAGWLLSYTLWGAAALHLSMRELTEPRRQDEETRVQPTRIALLLAVLLTPPVVLLIQDLRGASLNVPGVVTAMIVISLLVVLRLVGMLNALDRVRRRLVEADRLKDEFVALISHDLRTPLTSIMGYTELALDDSGAPLDTERRGYLDIVARSSQRLLRLVDDLLFVARLQAGHLELTPKLLDLRDLAQQAAREAQRQADAKGVELVVQADRPVSVDADKGRMFQLLDNLVSNAIKFTPHGGRVQIRVERNGAAVLEVSDTGIGFTEAEASRLFERFFRTDTAVEEQVPGTGLGLHIAQAITEAHGGTITASPRRGGGAVFRIELPSPTGGH
jgi:signal transduction histidine kinase